MMILVISALSMGTSVSGPTMCHWAQPSGTVSKIGRRKGT